MSGIPSATGRGRVKHLFQSLLSQVQLVPPLRLGYQGEDPDHRRGERVHGAARGAQQRVQPVLPLHARPRRLELPHAAGKGWHFSPRYFAACGCGVPHVWGIVRVVLYCKGSASGARASFYTTGWSTPTLLLSAKASVSPPAEQCQVKTSIHDTQRGPLPTLAAGGAEADGGLRGVPERDRAEPEPLHQRAALGGACTS
jgi:hypothetical protein